MPAYWWNGLKYVDLETGDAYDPFIPGVTQPFYVETADFSGDRNVGTNPLVPLTPYAGTPNASGVIQINDGALYENVLFQHVTEVRSAATFKNCRWVLPKTHITTGLTNAVVLILNGAGANNIVFEDCEIHNRAQRPMNGIMGRNFVMRKSVITGCVDPWSEASGGSAPLTTRGFEVYDSIAPSVAWWWSPTVNTDIHVSDNGSHSDVYQSNTTLEVLLDNCTLGAYVSEFIGTGTPGSGSDAGNTYVPPGYNFIQSQATMEGWRSTHAGVFTNAAQSMGGVSRRQATAGSLAAVMLNDGSTTIRHCWIGGGTVGINAADSGIVASTVDIIDCIFWNDMLNGPASRSSNPAVKGNAIMAITAHGTFGTVSGNRWADSVGGALLTRVVEGSWALWR